jgi:hypothetical protein
MLSLMIFIPTELMSSAQAQRFGLSQSVITFILKDGPGINRFEDCSASKFQYLGEASGVKLECLSHEL